MNEKVNFYQSTFELFFSVDLCRESLLALSVNQKIASNLDAINPHFQSRKV